MFRRVLCKRNRRQTICVRGNDSGRTVMNKIFAQVEKHMLEALKANLPDVSTDDLEKDGAIFYMNGQNGTAFDWHVNDRLSNFFIFYNDKENLGAVKGMLYKNGSLDVYTYGNKGHDEPVETHYKIDADEKELLDLAVLLTKRADGKSWDEDIRKLDADGEPDAKETEDFLSQEKVHEPMRQRKQMYGKSVIVSKKVFEGNWKIGYGSRMEPTRETDSGWFFCVGDEDGEYINNPKNLELTLVASILHFDPALNEFITAPYGTEIIRVAPDRFEEDGPGKRMLIEKRK